MKTTTTMMLTGLSLIGLASACDRGPELEPAKSADEAENIDHAVEASEGGVRVVAQAKDWPGDADIYTEVTPLRVIIENKSTHPLQIRYSDFELTTQDGGKLKAIPPILVSGVVEDEPEYVEPAFYHDNFYVAPYYGAYYPGVRAYVGPFAYDNIYYDTYYGYWETTTALPTAEMLRRALPEGVVEPGGRVDGYLYFEHVGEAREGQQLWFAAELGPADHGTAQDQAVASVRMPFVVD